MHLEKVLFSLGKSVGHQERLILIMRQGQVIKEKVLKSLLLSHVLGLIVIKNLAPRLWPEDQLSRNLKESF